MEENVNLWTLQKEGIIVHLRQEIFDKFDGSLNGTLFPYVRNLIFEEWWLITIAGKCKTWYLCMLVFMQMSYLGLRGW